MLIIGASVRAAAQSALRAGWTADCIDLFADADLARRFNTLQSTGYPHDLVSLARRMPPGPWLYTGGLENYAKVVDRIAAGRQLLGNTGAVLRQVRNPATLYGELERQGVPCPEWRIDSRGLPLDGSWLCKGTASSGGHRVEPLTASTQSKGVFGKRYFQRRVDGTSCAAIYVAAKGEARLLGVSRQLVGEEWTGAGAFKYCGSLAPMDLAESERESILRVGQLLANSFELVGLFGVDGILASGTFWPVEVNPRYTASVEVLERAYECSAIQMHVAACLDGGLPEAMEPRSNTRAGKAIVYARGEIAVGDWAKNFLDHQTDRATSWPAFADIPRAGSVIREGWPILSVLVEDADFVSLERRLKEQAARIERIAHQAAASAVHDSR